MSDRVGHIEILKSDGFRISKETWLRLHDAFKDGAGTAECSIVDRDWPKHKTKIEGGYLYPHGLWWSGEGSLSNLDVFTDELLPVFDGSADILVVTKDGGLDGYRLENHRVTHHKVVISLGEQE